MGPIQIIILFIVFIIVKNYMWEKEKKNPTVLGTAIEIIVIVVIVLALEYFFPILR